MSFKWFEFGFEYLESLSNGSNLHSYASNLIRMVQICLRMLRILFEWFKFGFKQLEYLLNGLNLHSNASNPFQMVRICITMVRILFEWLEFVLECCSNGSKLHSNGSTPFRMFYLHSNASNSFQTIRICIPMVRMVGIWLKFAFECFKSHSSGLNLHSNGALECFESHSNCSNWHLNVSNPFRMVGIWF